MHEYRKILSCLLIYTTAHCQLAHVKTVQVSCGEQHELCCGRPHELQTGAVCNINQKDEKQKMFFWFSWSQQAVAIKVFNPLSPIIWTHNSQGVWNWRLSLCTVIIKAEACKIVMMSILRGNLVFRGLGSVMATYASNLTCPQAH